MKNKTLTCGNYNLAIGRRTLIMGIVNITPDSFSDGGRFFSRKDAVIQAQRLADQGADILDIGGESTRPFSDPVTEEEEIKRVVPVIEKIAKAIPVPISIDTTKAAVAKQAAEAGASIINDVSAMRVDPEMAKTAAETGLPIILMHMKGSPKTMQVDPHYDDLIGEIKSFLSDAVEKAMAAGVSKSKVVIDPGIGFGKTLEHNLLLIQKLQAFKELGLPVMIGPSRKKFIRTLVNDSSAEDIDPGLSCVEVGTQATVAASALNGAHIVRVHNVKDTVDTLKIIDAIKTV